MSAGSVFQIRDARPGFLRVDNDLYDRFGAQLGPYGLAVYMALCRYANSASSCWPSYARIAAGTGVSRRKVIYEIAKMADLGIIAIEHHAGTSNTFVLLDTSAQHAPGSAQHAPLPVHHVHPSSARGAPKQSLRNKGSTPDKRNNRQRYIPEEYASIIQG